MFGVLKNSIFMKNWWKINLPKTNMT